jgi:hypothetical protein
MSSALMGIACVAAVFFIGFGAGWAWRHYL